MRITDPSAGRGDAAGAGGGYDATLSRTDEERTEVSVALSAGSGSTIAKQWEVVPDHRGSHKGDLVENEGATPLPSLPEGAAPVVEDDHSDGATDFYADLPDGFFGKGSASSKDGDGDKGKKKSASSASSPGSPNPIPKAAAAVAAAAAALPGADARVLESALTLFGATARECPSCVGSYSLVAVIILAMFAGGYVLGSRLSGGRVVVRDACVQAPTTYTTLRGHYPGRFHPLPGDDHGSWCSGLRAGRGDAAGAGAQLGVGELGRALYRRVRHMSQGVFLK